MNESSEPLVFVLEDDLETRSLLLRGLREEGFRAEGAGSGAEALARIRQGRPDLIIVDIGLPDADGRDVCQALRARGILTPVLFLTARTGLPDRLAGFNSGGDDYLTKPFAFEELVVRLLALLRRCGGRPTPVTVGGMRLDPVMHAAVAGGIVVPLTPTEFRILGRLAATPGEVVRRGTLVEVAWTRGAKVHDNTLDAYIARIRRKLALLPDPPTISTAHGLGYAIR